MVSKAFQPWDYLRYLQEIFYALTLNMQTLNIYMESTSPEPKDDFLKIDSDFLKKWNLG